MKPGDTSAGATLLSSSEASGLGIVLAVGDTPTSTLELDQLNDGSEDIDIALSWAPPPGVPSRFCWSRKNNAGPFSMVML